MCKQDRQLEHGQSFAGPCHTVDDGERLNQSKSDRLALIRSEKLRQMMHVTKHLNRWIIYKKETIIKIHVYGKYSRIKKLVVYYRKREITVRRKVLPSLECGLPSRIFLQSSLD